MLPNIQLFLLYASLQNSCQLGSCVVGALASTKRYYRCELAVARRDVKCFPTTEACYERCGTSLHYRATHSNVASDSLTSSRLRTPASRRET